MFTAIIFIFDKLQLDFNPMAVAQQYKRQVTYITQTKHKHNTKTQNK
jgi:hypothetical protein